jgi:GH35 family endo-1,4-beta-xylanase
MPAPRSFAALLLSLAACATSERPPPNQLPDRIVRLHAGLAGLADAEEILPSDDPARMWLFAQPNDAAESNAVDVTGMPFQRARRVRTDRALPQPWHVQLTASNTTGVARGDVLLAAAWVRATGPKPDGAMPALWAQMRETVSSWRTLAGVYRPLSTEWQEVYLPCRVDRDYASGTIGFVLFLGSEVQEVEVGGLVVLNVGRAADLARLPATPSSYEGREPSAPWRAEAARRIEQLRKGDLRVVVVGADGRPQPGARVSVRMLRHAFWFGTAVSSRLLADTPEGERYRTWTKRLFNKVTMENEMKWSPWEGDPNYPRARQNSVDVGTWARANGLAMRGHTLVWGFPEFLPPDVRGGLGRDALRERIRAHVIDEVNVFRGGIAEWDVHSEPVTVPGLTDVLGWDAATEWYELTESLDPAARMYANENSMVENASDLVLDQFLAYVRRLQAAGAPIEGVSPQSHFFGGPLLSPSVLLRKLERLAQLGLEIQPDQFEVVLSDERCQADYLRDYYTVAFSHPSVVGVIAWGYWESDMWMPQAAFLHSDGSLRPGGQAYMDLVLGKWWTSEDGVTGADGALVVRGFLGDYRVTAEIEGRRAEASVALPRAGAELRLALPER